MTRAIHVVDVFSATPFRGNPVAVILGAEGLDGPRMQAIAAWTNLSETTFHLPPTRADADYRLRIFTPRGELPFAGHPTIGSAHALIEAGLVAPRNGRVVQECGAGLVPVTLEPGPEGVGLSLELPEPDFRDLADSEADELAALLGAAPVAGARASVVDVGPRWMVAQLADAGTVLGITPDPARCAAFDRRLGVTGVTVFGVHASGEAAIEVRSFAPAMGVPEDPVCGSGNGAVAAWRLRAGRLAEGDAYLAAQGRCVGRDGQVRLRVAGGKIHVGGAAVTTLTGSLRA